MVSGLYFLKYNWIKQVKTYKFLFICIITVFLGCLCVPRDSAGYEVIYLGGVRGIYNSAWLGAVGALLPSVLLWLPCFYYLRSQISEDERFELSNIISSTPINKFQYIMGKIISNFLILVSFALIFMMALVSMQFVMGEALTLDLRQYIVPFIVITIPNLFILSVLTIFFDVFDILRGTFGNIVIFIIWIVLLSISATTQNSSNDLFGIGTVLKEMIQGAQKVFPEIQPDIGGLGFNITNGSTITFVWHGMIWDKSFLVSRIIWMLGGGFIACLSTIRFDRFVERSNLLPQNDANKIKHKMNDAIKTKHKMNDAIPLNLTISPIYRSKIPIFKLIKYEIKLMMLECKWWWYFVSIICMVLSFVLPIQYIFSGLYLMMILPIGIWSQMGCRENYYFTTELIESSCSLVYKKVAELLGGIGISIIFSLGILMNLSMQNDWRLLTSWIIGILFVPTLGLFLGSIFGNRRFFEAVYIILFYFGPLNGIPFLDFLGVKQSNSLIFFMITIILILVLYCIAKFIKKEQ